MPHGLHRLLTIVVVLALATLFLLWLLQFFPRRAVHPGLILPVGIIAQARCPIPAVRIPCGWDEAV
jgi:hypothetical protein